MCSANTLWLQAVCVCGGRGRRVCAWRGMCGGGGEGVWEEDSKGMSARGVIGGVILQV